GCSSICEVELGYKCTWSMSQGSICALEEYCGDGTCNNGETCSTCSNDCGTCPSSGENENNAGGGGGGGGGGSSSGSTSISVSGNNEPDSDEIISTKDLNKNKETTSQTGGMFNFLTGFVTGVGGFVNSTLGILVIVFVVLMIGLFVALRFFRIKKPKKK
ncbi:MAG TPA: hypothetical protein PLK34_02755, partial [Candidatus Pacearchaeota archaeon]|nr:hypothetical protein [Candidatus Pacearchaeota archaeon]